MAHYAFLDDKNMVTEVIVGIDEGETIDGIDPETWYGNFRGMACKRTSYNGNIRKNFAGIGYSYDPDRDAFIPPQPYSSWLLDETKCSWIAPVPYPTDNRLYYWDEEIVDWTPANDQPETA